jgi:hypothetical protein
MEEFAQKLRMDGRHTLAGGLFDLIDEHARLTAFEEAIEDRLCQIDAPGAGEAVEGRAIAALERLWLVGKMTSLYLDVDMYDKALETRIALVTSHSDFWVGLRERLESIGAIEAGAPDEYVMRVIELTFVS